MAYFAVTKVVHKRLPAWNLKLQSSKESKKTKKQKKYSFCQRPIRVFDVITPREVTINVNLRDMKGNVSLQAAVNTFCHFDVEKMSL